MQHALAELLDKNADHAGRFKSRFDDVQDGQRPEAVTVCCSDSRVLQDHMWGNDVPGHLFTSSNIGNRVVQRTDAGLGVSGDVLYPILHTDTDLVIIVGHTGCGAITAAYEDMNEAGSEPSGLGHSLELLRSTLEEGVELLPSGVDRTDAVNRLVEFNVDRQVDHLETSDDIPEGVTVVGVVYDFQDQYSGSRGEVHVINIDGERGVENLQHEYPEIATRIERRWEY